MGGDGGGGRKGEVRGEEREKGKDEGREGRMERRKEGEEVNQEGRKRRKGEGREVGQKMRCNVHCIGVRTNLSFELCVATGNELCQMSYGSRIHHCLG